MNHRHIFPFIFLLLSFVGIHAKTIDEAAFQILKNSLEFQSDSLTLRTLATAYKIENNLPDPQLDGEYLVAPHDVDNRWATELTWGIDWPGLYSAKGKEAKKKLSAAEESIKNKRLERLFEIKTLLLDYILCRQKLSLLEELTLNNDSIYKLSTKAVENQELSLLDLNKIKLEYANIKGAKATVLNDEASVLSELATIAGCDCKSLLADVDCKFPDIYLPAVDDLKAGIDNATAVNYAKTEVEAARQAKSVARMEALPSLSIGYKHAYEDGMHFNGGLLGISIPIFSSQGKQKAANAAIREAEFKIETARNSVENRMEQSLSKLKLLKQQIDEIEPILQSADHNAILLKAYHSGLITMVDYLTERNYFINASMEFLTLRHEAALAQAELQRNIETVGF